MAESKAVLVTGATGGIGAPVTRALLDRGLTVYAGVRGTPSPSLAGAIPVELDVTDPAAVTAAADRLGRELTGLHALVNNAGVIVQGPLELVPDAEWHRQFEVNVHGPVRLTSAFLPLLRAGRGRVVNISAPSARVALPFFAPMSASKAALASLSDAARLELAPFGIPVVQVEPGGTDTQIFAKAERAAGDALAGLPAGDRTALYDEALAAVAAANARQRLDPVPVAVKAVVAAVLDARPKTHYIAGNARTFAVLARLPRGLRDRLITRTLGLPGRVPATS